MTELMPNLSSHFDFERNFKPESWRQWSSLPFNRWVGLPIAASYVVVIFSLKAFMEKRERYQLRTILILWNFCLALFSWCGSMKLVPMFWDVVSTKGIDYSLCDDSLYRNPISSFWVAAFVFSKVPELLDTVFIVLRKQNLIFLHWFHHASVVVLAFGNWHAWPGIGWWQATMNYSVHSLMYSYYMLRSMNIKPPVIMNKIITTLQILQMVIVCVLGYRTFSRMLSGVSCGTETLVTSGLAFGLYFSYLILFVQFFYATYLSPTKKHRSKFD